ncbi:MAG: Tripartite tricarboxylate transporter TctB family protein [Syntrophorhabdus sp. PtaU1.Bin050]|jgi:hypothetical protein|nr:MAG: Tripartite tricarboxylate transporter TctB family protein [Syntrophorhabdus sp. PtaU1.Bin050]
MTTQNKGEVLFGSFWLAVGLFAVFYSFSLGLGSVHTPGSGLTPFLFGAVLCGFSAANLIYLLGKKPKDTRDVGLPLKSWKLGFMILCLLAYGVFLEPAGYLVATFVVMIFLFRFADAKWTGSVMWSAMLTGITYFLFSSLGVILPRGVLRAVTWL